MLRNYFFIPFICLNLLLLSCTPQNDAEFTYSQNKYLPIRHLIYLHDKNNNGAFEFSITEQDAGLYTAYLIFMRPHYQTPEAHQKIQQLSIMLDKLNYPELPTSENEKISFNLQIIDLYNKKIIYQNQIGFNKEDANLNEARSLFHDMEKEVVLADRFELKAGQYQLIYQNLHASIAYQPYQVYLQISKPYHFKI